MQCDIAATTRHPCCLVGRPPSRQFLDLGFPTLFLFQSISVFIAYWMLALDCSAVLICVPVPHSHAGTDCYVAPVPSSPRLVPSPPCGQLPWVYGSVARLGFDSNLGAIGWGPMGPVGYDRDRSVRTEQVGEVLGGVVRWRWWGLNTGD